MENCIFCKIIKNEIPSHKIHEDENFVAFLDIAPVSEGHILIIPKTHIVWMQEAEDEIIAEIFKLAKKLIKQLKSKLVCDYVNISVSGTDVPHFHIHLIPRYYNDGLQGWPTKTYEQDELAKIAEKIIQKII